MSNRYGEQRTQDLMPDDVGSPWVPDLSPASGNSGSIISLMENNKVEDTGTPERNKAIGTALQSGLQSAQAGGGLGGTLTGVGSSLGIGALGAAAGTPLAAAGPVGWGIMAGGMLLSAAEKKKQEQAAREQAAIAAEMRKRDSLMKIAMDSANSNESWV